MSDRIELKLRRLAILREQEPGSPLGPEVLVPGILEIRAGQPPYARLLACPDAVTLVSSLWQCRPYPAHGQVLRPRLVHPGPSTSTAAEAWVIVEVLWAEGRAAAVARTTHAQFLRQVTRLAGQVADVLVDAGEKATATLLRPALAGTPPTSP